ncbi:Oidioi.mRNA.OKI2018_I69.chr2.g5260.t1.cds [Oikopleura dioica]|uniref:Oidioi.mRNA.OKI2018_I69.chr2.g5260.t1.cds n=1 Tax=Oikopleura dioica TaxID=34765 RepID=A0ABN7T3J0_OIKDI|nr:Oidioi.mRNA.OKI2018_I69.chr2.g5260.t1.cds [Oikopleura dioica]
MKKITIFFLTAVSAGLTDFNGQITCYLGGYMSSQYVGYGCWCGRHNNGIPVDETDQCCFEHDNCYDEADKKFSSGIFLESLPQSYFKTYDYMCHEEHGVICRDDVESYSRKLCECDKAAASCFQRNRNSYNKYFSKQGEFNKDRFCTDGNRQKIQTENFSGCERNSPHEFCCGSKAYDNRFNLCCGGEVFSDILENDLEKEKMEGSSVNFYQIILINILITCMIMLYSGFYRREEDTVLSFFTIDEVDQMIEKKVKEEREKMEELEQEKFIEVEKEGIKIEENEEKPERRKAVLMVTFMRSGSTFLGEMFNNHDDAFYVFEPLHPLSKFGLSKSSLEDRFEILTDNLNCNFREQYDITIPWRSFKGEEMPLEESLDKKGDFVFRSKHRRLCAPPFCGRDFSKSLHQCNEECGLVDLSLASRKG